MIDPNLLSLLRQARSRLEHARPFCGKDRALVAKINRFITSRLPPAGPVEMAARRQAASIANLSIDPGERRIRAHGDGVEICCWYLLPSAKAVEADRTTDELPRHRLPALTRQILYLSQRCGFDGHEIAFILGISRRTVRAHFRKALSALRPGKGPPPA